MNRKFALYVILLVCFNIQAQTNYFVSSATGSDTNDGSTWEKAFASISKAADEIIATGGTTTYNVYVAEGSYDLGSSKQFNGSYMVNFYGGYPTPGTYTPPTDTCNYSLVENATTLATNTSINNSPFRLKGDGGGISFNRFYYDSTASGGVGDGSFLTLSGRGGVGQPNPSPYPVPDPSDCRNKVVTLDNFIIKEYVAGSGGFIYPFNVEDVQININNTYVAKGGAVSPDIGGAFIVARATSLPEVRNLDVTVNNSSFNNIRVDGTDGAGVFYMALDFGKDDGTSSLTIRNSSFCNNKNTQNGVVGYTSNLIVDQMKEIIVDNTIFNGNSGSEGGALRADDSKITVTNSTFDGNLSGLQGGAIYLSGEFVDPSATFAEKKHVITNSKFYRNRVDQSLVIGEGGAIYINGDVDLDITGSDFQENFASATGGAIRFNSTGGNVEIKSSYFCGNDANSNGGAINATGGGLLNTNSSVYTSNTSDDSGGAIYFEGNLTSTNDWFYKNIANVDGDIIGDGYGGGIYANAQAGSTVEFLKINGTVFKENEANSGGGVFAYDSQSSTAPEPHVTVNNSTFYGNKSKGNPGGAGMMMQNNWGYSIFTNNKFFNNQATGVSAFGGLITSAVNGGGGLFIKANNLGTANNFNNDNVRTFTGNEFAGNTLNGDATLKWEDGGSDIKVHYVVIADNTVSNNKFQLNSNDYNLYNFAGGFFSGFNNFDGTTNTFNNTAVTDPGTPPACPTVPATIECIPVDKIISPFANVTTSEGSPGSPDYSTVICETEVPTTSVTFYSTTGTPGYTYEYQIVTVDGATQTSTTGATQTIATSGTDTTVTVTMPTPTADQTEGVTYIYKIMSVTDASGASVDYASCGGADMARISVNPTPKINTDTPVVSCPGSDVVLFAELTPTETLTTAMQDEGAVWANSLTAASWKWEHPAGTTISTSQNPTITLANDSDYGDYIVTVTDNNGCTESETVVVVKPTVDSDGDGYFDICDNDDDNDGILDSAECDRAILANLAGYYAPGNFTDPNKFLRLKPEDFGITTNTGAIQRNLNLSHDYSSFYGLPPNSIIVTLTNAHVHATANDFITQSDAPTIVEFTGSIGVYLSLEFGTSYNNSTSNPNGSCYEKAIEVLDATNTTNTQWFAFSVNEPVDFQTGNNGRYFYQRHTNNCGNTSAAQLHYANTFADVMPKKVVFSTKNAAVNSTGQQDTFFIRILPECDTDKDGIPNRLDLDSDNDGCADAKEGGANLDPTNTSIGSLQSGNTVAGSNVNLTDTAVDTNGVPNTASGGQAIGQSQDANKNDCLDSDGDGTPDWTDLDDDNDGILDTDEIGCYWSSSDATTNILTATNSDFVWDTTNTLSNTADTDNNSFGFIDKTLNTSFDATDKVIAEYNIKTPVNITAITVKTKVLFENGLGEAKIQGWNGTAWSSISANLNGLNGNGDLETFTSTDTSTLFSKIRIVGVSGNLTSFGQNGGIFETRIVYPENTYVNLDCALDSDGDTIPDYLDLDSDNDGCPDAKEGGADLDPTNTSVGSLQSGNTIAGSNTNLPSPVGTGTTDIGVPTAAISGGTVGQTVGQSKDASKNDCLDSDGDGTPDWSDLDDDNDGILDTAEGLYCDSSELPLSGSYVRANGQTGTVDITGDGAYKSQFLFFNWYGQGRVNSSANNGIKLNAKSLPVTVGDVTYQAEVIEYEEQVNTLASNSFPQNPGPSTNLTSMASHYLVRVNTSQGLYPESIYKKFGSSSNPSNGLIIKYKFKITAKRNGVEIPNNFDIVMFESESLAANGTEFVEFSANSPINTLETFGSGAGGVDGVGTNLLKINGPTNSSNNTVFTTKGVNEFSARLKSTTGAQSFGFGIRLLCDTDNDGIPNSLDLDSDNDGCPDAKEGAADLDPTNTSVGSLESGNTITGSNVNLTDTDVDGNGVPNTASGGQAVGQSQDASKNDCFDSDNDGKPDWEDLDDDNDGILDTIECNSSTVKFLESSVETIPAGGTTSHTVTFEDGKTVQVSSSDKFYRNSDINVARTYPYSLVYPSGVSSQIITINLQFATPTKNFSLVLDDFDGSPFEKAYDFSINPTSVSTNNTVNIGTTANPIYQSNSKNQHIYLNYDLNTTITNLTFTVNSSGQGYGFNIELNDCQDTDGDTIPDYLDLDSDNDGCPDAKEGAADLDPTNTSIGVLQSGNTIMGSNVNLTETDVDANGVPNAASGGQAIGDSQNENVNSCSADLSLTKTVNNALPKVGQDIIYTLTVKNNGPSSTDDVEVTDALPTGLTYKSNIASTGTSYDESTNIWTIGTMEKDAVATLQITVTVTSAGIIVNKAEITNSSSKDSDSTPNNGQ